MWEPPEESHTSQTMCCAGCDGEVGRRALAWWMQSVVGWWWTRVALQTWRKAWLSTRCCVCFPPPRPHMAGPPHTWEESWVCRLILPWRRWSVIRRGKTPLVHSCRRLPLPTQLKTWGSVTDLEERSAGHCWDTQGFLWPGLCPRWGRSRAGVGRRCPARLPGRERRWRQAPNQFSAFPLQIQPFKHTYIYLQWQSFCILMTNQVR